MKNGNSTYLDTGIQKEFQSIFQQLYCSQDVRLEAFIGFDDNLVTSRNEINTDLVDKTHGKAIWYLLPIKREAGVEDESKSEGYDKDKDEIKSDGTITGTAAFGWSAPTQTQLTDDHFSPFLSLEKSQPLTTVTSLQQTLFLVLIVSSKDRFNCIFQQKILIWGKV